MKTSWAMTKLRVRDLAVLGLALYILTYMVIPAFVEDSALESYFRPHLSQQFDASVWKASGLIPDGKYGKMSPTYGKRYPMVDNLMRSHLAVGMDAALITAIIGRPDAGMLDKPSLKSLAAIGGLGQPMPAEKTLLENPDAVAFWYYHLASQSQYPARATLFPGWCFNFDRWKLEIKFRNGRVDSFSVIK